jgi:hypothetical protein
MPSRSVDLEAHVSYKAPPIHLKGIINPQYRHKSWMLSVVVLKRFPAINNASMSNQHPLSQPAPGDER